MPHVFFLNLSYFKLFEVLIGARFQTLRHLIKLSSKTKNCESVYAIFQLILYVRALGWNYVLTWTKIQILSCRQLGAKKYDENGQLIDDRNTEAGAKLGYKVTNK